MCRVVFALGQAKFCVFASTIRILAHFPGELASFTVFCSMLFNRRKEYVKLAPGFVASERTCSYQFSWLQTVKKSIHIGIFDFWLECDFPKCGTAAASRQDQPPKPLSLCLNNAGPIPDGVPALEGGLWYGG